MPTRSGSYRVPTAAGGDLAFISQQSHGGPVQINADLYHDQQTSLERRNTELPELFRLVAVATLRDAEHSLTADDRQFLADVARMENPRYQWKGLVRFMRLSSRSSEPLALSEAMRAATVAELDAPAPCVRAASEAEQAANEKLNLQQLIAAEDKTRSCWETMRAYALKQYEATRKLIDALNHQLAGAL